LRVEPSINLAAVGWKSSVVSAARKREQRSDEHGLNQR